MGGGGGSTLHCHRQNDSTLRWTARTETFYCFITVRGKVPRLCPHHNLSRRKRSRAEAHSNRHPSAYQPIMPYRKTKQADHTACRHRGLLHWLREDIDDAVPECTHVRTVMRLQVDSIVLLFLFSKCRQLITIRIPFPCNKHSREITNSLCRLHSTNTAWKQKAQLQEIRFWTRTQANDS